MIDMKTLLKYIPIVMMLFSIASCQEGEPYSPGEKDLLDCHGLFFPQEQAKAYEGLQKAVFAYAQAKGEYQGRYDSLKARYNEGTNIEQELTADLVGDYIFNDAFVVKEALEIMFDEGHKKLTIGSCCLEEFKRLKGKEDAAVYIFRQDRLVNALA